jgi:formylglycine-generating enzyme required for sulfatase activity/tRNA A-37 threonylcarbamoyl transferase component Bud32
MSATPTQVGPYKILSELGEGGMGTVYLAEQTEPVRRRVALKLIKLGMDSKAIVARFEQERQALALMQHDGIAKVFDCGTSERGQPYFVMEYVKGTPINVYCDRNRVSLPGRIALMQQVCAAVTHAHQKGVVHRDLKPGNVLITEDGDKVQVKIIDFGLAKAMGQKLVEATLFTEAGQVVGTPEYMAPEQADPTNADIDTRADVYSLGVMLHELLVGSLPFSTQELRAGGMLETQRILREVEPQKPSTKLKSIVGAGNEVASARRIPLGALRKALRSDLDWLVLKALEKDRSRRYETANALAADLQRYLDREPLVAGPPSAAYRLRKLLQRYRGEVLAAAAVLVTAVAGTVVALDYAFTASRLAKDNGELADGLASKVREFDHLAGVVWYQRAIEREKNLYPAWPDRIDVFERWLREDCGRLLALRPEIERTVRDLRARGLGDEAARFLHDTLTDLLGKLDGLAANEKVAVERRLQWAQQIGELTRDHPRARVGWAATREAIRNDERYRGASIELRDRDVIGLVPMGRDPQTGYQEFYHLHSAWDGESDPRTIAIPEHRPDGSIAMHDDTGIVFVLLPGGTFTMGAQSEVPSRPHHDPQARPDESPVHEVTLAPFFLSRHELTKGQWQRLSTQRDASWLRIGHADPGNPEPIGWTHPVENVDWTMGERLLRQHGLALPTEAQWEYGCRAGTSTPWWSGPTAANLDGCANVLDRHGAQAEPGWGRQEGDFDDRRVTHGPVGSYRPNGFGLYDTHGNVWEWCRDAYGSYETPPRAGDGLRHAGGAESFRITRGGGFRGPAGLARSGYRHGGAPTFRFDFIGLRAARAVSP